MTLGYWDWENPGLLIFGALEKKKQKAKKKKKKKGNMVLNTGREPQSSTNLIGLYNESNKEVSSSPS